MTTDHYFKRGDLEGIAARVQNGQPLTFDPKNVADIIASLNSGKSNDKILKRLVAVCFLVFCFLLVITAMVLAIFFMLKTFIR